MTGESTVDPQSTVRSRLSGSASSRTVDGRLSTVDSWAIVAVCVIFAGCAQRAAAPGGAIEAYAAAIERKDYAGAYGLMSSSYRQQVSLPDFRRTMERDATELAADARSLRDSADRWTGRVTVAMPGDERVSLSREGGGWRLEAPPIDPYGQASPRAALRSFVRAVESRRYDVLVRLAPARFRSTLTADKLRAFWEGPAGAPERAFLRELRLNLYARIAEEGEEAFMTYGTGRQVRFVREEGLWRIESPE
jgi:hypothetical protein